MGKRKKQKDREIKGRREEQNREDRKRRETERSKKLCTELLLLLFQLV